MDEIAARDASLLRDPNRRWLRHTYQEGPGFRFLATRGGRPPERWRLGRQLDIVRQRARLLSIARCDTWKAGWPSSGRRRERVSEMTGNFN
jgi:hypothetical protein